MDPTTDPQAVPADLNTPASEVSSNASTPEEVEEFWRKRMAGKERAWNASEEVLRGQIGSLQQQLTATPPANGQANGHQADVATQQIVELQRQLEGERAARTVDQRKIKYPALATQSGKDQALWTHADEATLAALNALAEDNPGTQITSNSPKRSAPVADKSMADLTKDELLARFKPVAEAYDQSRRP